MDEYQTSGSIENECCWVGLLIPYLAKGLMGDALRQEWTLFGGELCFKY